MAAPEAPGYRSLLASPGVAPLLTATLLARLATRMFSLTLVLFTLGRFHAPALAGWAAFLAIAPGLVVSPLAGALLDRLGTLRGIGIDLVLAAAVTALLALAGAGLAPGAVLALAGLYSLSSPLGWGGIRATLPRLVPAALWPRVNALDTATHGAVDVTGPALAGIVVASLGPAIAFAIIAAICAAAALALLAVGPVPAPAATRRSLGGDIADAIRHFARHRTLRALALSYALYNAAWGALTILVPLVARAAFGGRGDATAGLLWALVGGAGILGALLAGRVRLAGRERRFLALGMVATALAIFPLAAFGGLAGLALALVVTGLAAGPVDVALMTLRQRRTAPAWYARVLVLSMSLNVAGMPLGAALAGQLAPFSRAIAFAAAALAALAGAAAGALVPPEPVMPESVMPESVTPESVTPGPAA